MANNEECIFCKIAKGEIDSKKVYEDESFFGILDVKPVVEGHTLIISKKHFKNILDVPSSLGGEMLDAIKKVGLDLIKEKSAEGFNVIVNTNESAGQIVNHFHAHVLPRKKGDGLKGFCLGGK